MKNIIALVLTMFISFSAVSEVISERLHVCEGGCKQANYAENLAYQYKSGTFTIMSFDRETVTTYSITKSYEKGDPRYGEPGAWIYNANSSFLDVQAKQKFDAILPSYRKTKYRFMDIVLGGYPTQSAYLGGIDSAWDLVGNSIAVNSVEQYIGQRIQQDAQLAEYIVTFSANASQILGKVFGTNFLVTVFFEDGTSWQFIVNGYDTNTGRFLFKLVPNAGKNIMGGTIPSKSGLTKGMHYIAPQETSSYNQYSNRLDVINLGNFAQTGGAFTCVMENGSVVCRKLH